MGRVNARPDQSGIGDDDYGRCEPLRDTATAGGATSYFIRLVLPAGINPVSADAMKNGPGGAVTLPHWLQVFYVAVAEAPWTNIKGMNGEVLTYATAIFLAVASLLRIELKEWLVYAWLGFLSGKIGFAMGGAWVKRATYKPAPPYGPDIEDAQAGATATPAKPTVPQGKVKPSDPAVVTGIEAIAAKQRAAITNPPAEPDD